MKKLSALLLSSVLLTSTATLAYADTDVNQIALQSAIVLPKAQQLKPFKVQIQTKDQKTNKVTTAQFTNENLKGHWTLLFFGFTNCPALCPTTMAELSKAYKTLTEDKYSPMPQVVFVSVDPERDTLDKVTQFAHAFNPDFIGARTSDEKMLTQMTHETDTMFEKIKGKDKDKKGHYTITHSGDVIVINPKGEFVGLLRMPHTDKDIVADYKAISTQLAA